MNEKVKQAFKTLKEFLRMTDDDENPTNSFYHEEELNIIETALNYAEENEKALKVIFGEILNNSAFQIEVIEDSDACIIIKEYCLGNFLRDFKIPFDRRYIDLVKNVVEKYGQEEKTRVEK